ncbi:alcohol dehydrogenase catalytic domain-containing protein [Rudanella paleaurantiibacter]|uniref:Alcohol dehydrogenase catalytic domain-containing protein n=1 Tax=Rudanella paleaurantiibacter TaxID=2614655 RepID=A0A7J5U5B0_9BACT|nr:zinc-binding dehydrogenase [Rudanella paleaurantiibacter]KAB7733024.1 alcohol dehydrogenase catalytic domain-containing protein [Rudanella paleaurantiibacter]
MKSAAVVNYAPERGSVEIRELDCPTIGDDDVLLEVAAVGVCGSDLHQWTADHSWPVNYPVVLGHEFGGHIIQLGKRVVGWQEGDRVVSETAAIIDPNNPMSRQGLYNLDPTRKGFGYGVNGAMTRYVRVPARCLHRVPDSLPFEQACLTEPCCVAFNAVVENTRLKPGDRVLVLGPGTIGILCAAMARLCGAEVAVVGLEADRHRLDIARQYGCEAIVGDATAWARQRDGLGADVVIDAAGVSATLQAALQLVRPNGHITKVGWGPQPLGFSLDPLVQKNVTLQGSFSHNWPIWERVLALLTSGQLDVRPIIGGVWSVTDWHEAFEQMHTGAVVKSVLKPV